MGATAANNALEKVFTLKLREKARAEATRAAELLQDATVRGDVVLTAPHHTPVHVPAEAVQAMGKLLKAIADGNSVAVLAPSNAAISTSEAAQLLGVSRPHIVKLVEAGILPASKPGGSHRRLRVVDVLSYYERVNVRHAALDALIAETENLGLYEAPAVRPTRPKARKTHRRRAARADR